MQGKILLHKEDFSNAKKSLLEWGEFKIESFIYSTGVHAITLTNSKGYVTLLPFMGQMIWDMEFLGKNLVMKSIYDEPYLCKENYSESYGCFLMHCGLTAMGNPAPCDNHQPHGELTIAPYEQAYILFDEDEKGKYIALSGIYNHKRPFGINYQFSPECRLYENASQIELTINIKNNKDLPLEYFYLCHINYKPIDNSKLLYTAKHEDIFAHKEVPEDYPEPQASKTRAYLEALSKDASIMDTVGGEGQSYAPEIVFTCKYYADENGEAHTLQLMPDGYSCYVSHRPDELPYGIRWIARTEDEDALGMILPATAEHKGYTYCKERGQEKYLKSGESIQFHIKTGILSPEDTKIFKNKI